MRPVLPWIAAGLALAGLAACAQKPPKWAAPAPTIAPVVIATPVPDARKPDLCAASGLAYLVGRPRTEIPIPVDPATRRVSCTTCMAPDDHSDTRQEILFDAETGLVKAVGCG